MIIYFLTRVFLHHFINNCNLAQLIDEPTREPSNTLLDVIMTNSPASVYAHGVLEPICSDHKPVYACLNFTHKYNSAILRTMWDFKNADFDLFRNILSNTNWDFIDVSNDINHITDVFTEKFMKAAKIAIPNKQCYVRGKDKPWMHNEIRKQIRKRRRIHRLAKRMNTPEQWHIHRIQRNKVTSLIRKSKEQYYNKLAGNLNSDHTKSTKSWWNLCKFLYTGKTNNHGIPPLINGDNVITNDIDKTEIFNSYFASISSIGDPDDNLPVRNNESVSSITSIHITRQEVIDIIQSLKRHKACGFDLSNHILLKESIEIMSLPLSILFNKSLSLEKFPDKWKMANVTPIYKSKEPNQVSNYGPKSLLSCLGKVFERCIFKHVYNYLHNNNVISMYQSGFTPGNSTTNQLVSIYHDVCTALDDHKDIQLIFFDISKAFDKVWHKGLLFKMESIGIKHSLLNWFQDYLHLRKQRVVINGKTSSWKTINAGVPQGSVLGPLLFLIYINDISMHLSSRASLFADNTSLSKHISDYDTDSGELQNDLNIIENWTKQWKVKFNPLKSDALFISRRLNRRDDTVFVFQDHAVNNVKEHRHLGLVWSNNGSWKNHLLTIINKAAKRVDMLRALKYKLNKTSLERIYQKDARNIDLYCYISS